MKALVLEKMYSLSMKDVPIPDCPEGWALVKVISVSVCGSDFHSFKGGNALLTYPRIMGHEVCGIIESINGNSESFSIGDKVILMPYLSCGHCKACKKGKTNCCSSLSVYGVHREGAMAEFYAAPLDHLIKVAPDMSSHVAALIEPLAISTHAVSRGEIKIGDVVLVVGAGPIGIGAALMARIDGATVLVSDTNEARRRYAMDAFGFEHVLDPLDPAYASQILLLTSEEGPDVIIDSTGNNRSMENDVNFLSNGGRMVFVGISNKPIALDGTQFHKRETELFDSRAAKLQDFEKVIRCIESGKLDPLKMVTHRAVFSESKEAFVQWNELGGDVFKAVIDMTEKK
ncbi:zinc-binding alcohol dehydrogenase family protein [uncultured Sphaerochaeta sp.]|uniref:zinc-binding alcohol dehydrogenase family protein n=1 Tax=uncultured Sphaerochaeta sp. TaxID=886478 RepID=UPI002A0A6774|nr:zinc-binding alcohol dehydrogenase family protein [uncultured Sphaerochaeta sp.]